jgi:hypothetical protein
MSTGIHVILPVPTLIAQIQPWTLYKQLLMNIGGEAKYEVECQYGSHLTGFSATITEDRKAFFMHWTYTGSDQLQAKAVSEHTLVRWNHHCDRAIEAGRRTGDL